MKCSDEKQKQQNERKAARYAEEIKTLKSMSRDDISKHVLMSKRTFSAVLKKEAISKKIDMKMRSYVRVSEHKAVKKIVLKFREENPEWETRIQRLIATLGKRYKKKKTQEKDEPSSNDDVSDNEEDDVEESESDKEEEMEDDREQTNSDSDDSSEGEETFVNSLKEAINDNKAKAKPSVENTRSGEGVVKMLDLKNMKDVAQLEDDPRAVNSSTNRGQKRSSFFLGGESDQSDDDEDVAEESDGEADTMIEKKFEMFKNTAFNSKHKPERSFQNSKYKKHEKNFSRKKQFQKDISVQSSQSYKKQDTSFNHSKNKIKTCQKPTTPASTFPTATRENKSISSNVNVHPSWAAKQKQKASIANFQGKKTVFE